MEHSERRHYWGQANCFNFWTLSNSAAFSTLVKLLVLTMKGTCTSLRHGSPPSVFPLCWDGHYSVLFRSWEFSTFLIASFSVSNCPDLGSSVSTQPWKVKRERCWNEINPVSRWGRTAFSPLPFAHTTSSLSPGVSQSENLKWQDILKICWGLSTWTSSTT